MTCVFCGGTGVHECPGGELTPGYFARKRQLEGTEAFHIGLDGTMQVFPGLVDADAFPNVWEQDSHWLRQGRPDGGDDDE